MAETTAHSAWQMSDFIRARMDYSILRERMNQTAAVAAALGMLQDEDTHAFHLAALLDDRMGDAEFWYRLDKYFCVDNHGDWHDSDTTDDMTGKPAPASSQV